VFLTQARYAELQQKGLQPGIDILNCLRKGFVDIRTKAGIDEGTVHDMRRTFITNWLRKPEMSPEEVQLLAGHEDIMTTLKVYSEVNEADVVAKAKRLLQKAKESASTIASTTEGS
jgi:integrase